MVGCWSPKPRMGVRLAPPLPQKRSITMSTYTFPVSDKGLAVKLEEINLTKMCAFIQETYGINLEPEEGETPLDALREFICDDTQRYLGEARSDGVICHKWSYGNDIYGDFVPLLDGVREVAVDVEADDWIMMCLPRYASLFERAYESEAALIDEMKRLYGRFLPDDFNYRERLARLAAVAWG